MSLFLETTDDKLANLSAVHHECNRKNLNDLAGPPKACVSSIPSRPCVVSGSISPKLDSSECASKICKASAVYTTSAGYLSSSNGDFNPKHFTTTDIASVIYPTPSGVPTITKAKPILIPYPTLYERDINRVSTPLSARGDRKGHLFPFSRSPSPRELTSHPTSQPRKYSSAGSNNGELFDQLERARSTSPAYSVYARPRCGSFNMHGDSLSAGWYPTSPLSHKLSSKQGVSPQNSQRRGNHGRQASRSMQVSLGRFHPSNFPQADASHMGMQAPHTTYTRAPAPTLPPDQIESPRLLRQKHREFLEKAKLSSKLAASPLSIKPDAPRLDPLGSPKGQVTPLALEEGGDYFSSVGAGKLSPVGSPDNRSPRAVSRANSVSSDEETKPSKSRKLTLL